MILGQVPWIPRTVPVPYKPWNYRFPKFRLSLPRGFVIPREIVLLFLVYTTGLFGLPQLPDVLNANIGRRSFESSGAPFVFELRNVFNNKFPWKNARDVRAKSDLRQITVINNNKLL